MIDRMFVKVSSPSYDSLDAARTLRTSRNSEAATPDKNATTIATPTPARRLRFSMTAFPYTRLCYETKPPCSRRRGPGVARHQAFDRGHLPGRIPLARADDMLDDAARPVDEEALRIAPDSIAAADVAVGVEQHRERHL